MYKLYQHQRNKHKSKCESLKQTFDQLQLTFASDPAECRHCPPGHAVFIDTAAYGGFQAHTKSEHNEIDKEFDQLSSRHRRETALKAIRQLRIADLHLRMLMNDPQTIRYIDDQCVLRRTVK